MSPGGNLNFFGSPVSPGTHPGFALRVGIAAFGRSSRRLGTGRRIGPNRLGDPVGSSVRCSSLHNPVPSIRSANREHVYRSSDSDVTRYRSSGRCSNEHNHILRRVVGVTVGPGPAALGVNPKVEFFCRSRSNMPANDTAHAHSCAGSGTWTHVDLLPIFAELILSIQHSQRVNMCPRIDEVEFVQMAIFGPIFHLDVKNSFREI